MNVRGQGAHADIASLLLRAMIGHLQAPSRKYVRRCISARRFGKGLEWVGAATEQRKARGGESGSRRPVGVLVTEVQISTTSYFGGARLTSSC